METTDHMSGRVDRSLDAARDREGTTTKKLEKMTAELPSATWLLLGGGAMVGALALKVMGRDAAANFVGQWVPTLLMLGVYNKIVKVMGSDRTEHSPAPANAH